MEKELASKIFILAEYNSKENMEEHIKEYIKEYIKRLKDTFPFSVVTREFYKGENILVRATFVENKTNRIKIANEKSKEREDDWYIRQRGER